MFDKNNLLAFYSKNSGLFQFIDSGDLNRLIGCLLESSQIDYL